LSLFKISRGSEANLPIKKTDGWAYFCTDTGSFWIDHYDANNTLVRSKISANFADKLRYVKGGETIELDPSEIATKDYVATQLSSKADASHTHDDRYYTEDEIDAKLDSLNVKPDWSQNDPDAADYIKNRTHWVEDERTYTIYTGTLGTAGAGAVKPAFLEMDEPLIEGDEYIVTLNGVTYTLTAAVDEYDWVYIGDNSYTFTLIPFKLYNDSDTSQTFEINKNGDWNLTVKHHVKEIHQLDEKFIPDSIARVHNWTQIYDSGATTKKVNAFSNISLGDYTNIMVAIKVVNVTDSAGTTGGAITFVGQNTGNSYAFRNILPDLIKNTTGTTGGMAIFKIIDGFIICENAMRSTSATNMLSTTEASGADNLVPVGGGVIACTDKIVHFYVGNTNSSKTHYFGAGSRVVVWGCKA
jgi:hypothetical protein